MNRSADYDLNVSFLPCIEKKFSQSLFVFLLHMIEIEIMSHLGKRFCFLYDLGYVICVVKWR